MKNRLRWALYAQVLFFAAWAAWCMTNFSGAPYVWLDTSPVDPRDFISGQFVRLVYPAGNLDGLNCPTDGKYFFVRLEAAQAETSTKQGPVRVFEAKACAASPENSGLWVKAKRGRLSRAEFGIERFYMNENNPLLNARSGSLVAKVAIGRNYNMRVLELAEKNQNWQLEQPR